MKVSIGIDIGSDGAWAMFIGNKLSYGKIPTVDKEQDINELANILLVEADNKNISEDVDFKIHAVVEDLHSVFGTSAKSNFSFGYNNGMIIGFLKCCCIPYTKVTPKAWQKQMWQGIRPVEKPTGKKKKDGSPKYKVDTKATSLIAAKRLFPNESFLATVRSKVPHDGIVDAVLMAEYCRRNF